ncbi:HlyD family efflux transporter periplasmic adaptor subunit [Roseibium sp. FZY0029]|uniref:HlyD family secretion protein n=1 Tax=Roseibium sp. FZY0029 TaxID=3116647 RepID=UPI002EBC32FD|nr:HlyD family efflux transporter periplasmic adaptor subunit [Roseibium sp. FZY0029]
MSIGSRKLAILFACLSAIAFSAPPALAENAFDRIVQKLRGNLGNKDIASSNGRIEAQNVDVAGKYPGRLTQVLAREGQTVEAGDVLATLDDRDIQAKLLAAKASVLQGKASKQQAEAAVSQAESALSLARSTYKRIEGLKAEGHVSQAELDDATNTLKAAEASLAQAHAQVSSGDALIAAAEANVEEINVQLDDLTIRSPIRGRVEYRLHEPGEVIDAGTPVVTLLDLTDVYMNLYLPADVVGVLSINDEARMVLDPVPQYVIPARVTFIESQAQFTPKSVETHEERSQLVFRVKLTVPRDLLSQFEDRVKVGIRGVGFVRSDPAAAWPDDLQVKLPQ